MYDFVKIRIRSKLLEKAHTKLQISKALNGTWTLNFKSQKIFCIETVVCMTLEAKYSKSPE